MTGPLEQVVTLTTYGNEFLESGSLIDGFSDKNSAFQFCNKVEFLIFKRPFFLLKRKETVVAGNPGAWFRYLKNEGCKKLRLYFESSKDQSRVKDYKLAGLIGGGGTWIIEAVYEPYSDGWTNRWEVTRKDDPENKIWSVSYGQIIRNMATINLQLDQQQCSDKLKEALEEIRNFAFQHKLDNWTELFNRAMEALYSENPERYYYNSQLIPIIRFSLISRQILFGAATAWVFGAMGSWNDLGFDSVADQNQYESLTETLYACVNQAIISAVNSY